MTSKRNIIERLNKNELLAVVSAYALQVTDKRVKSELVDAVAKSRKATAAAVLGDLSRYRLKAICRELGLDDSGKEKAVIIERLIGSPPAQGAAFGTPPALESPPLKKGAGGISSRSTAATQSTSPSPPLRKGGQERKRASVKSQNGNGANGNGTIVDLTNELWQAAVNLRGSIEPADYKRYVLPIIFLRFLSIRYEKRRAELEKLVADPKSDYFADSRAIEDPDEYQSVSTFIVPEEARWQRIVDEVARRDDVKVQMDQILKTLEDTYPEKLRGLLPPIYAGSNLDAENLRGLINLFAKEIFEADHGGEDVIGRVYEYFIGEFASSEGKRGGEYFTPASIVKTLVAMLEPETGKVFDPCCGSGGMFVQSDTFTNHNGRLSFYGQESKDFTYRLCRMNLFIHGLDGDIRMGNTYFNDQHDQLKADYVIANPPFNDGSKGENGWGADKLSNKDPRLDLGLLDDDGRKRPMPLSVRNANTMWMLHFLSHLAPGGTAGFVMATGELSNSETARLEVRKTLVDLDLVDCIVQMPGQLFAQTGIPCALWFLSRNRDGSGGFRKRLGEILFIDARNLGQLIAGSRKQKFLSDDEIERIAGVYRQFRRSGKPEDVGGFCGVASTESVVEYRYALTPGRYVGSDDADVGNNNFDEVFPALAEKLFGQFSKSEQLMKKVRADIGALLGQREE